MQTPINQSKNDTPIRVMVAGGSLDMRNYLTHLLNKTPSITLAAITTDIGYISDILVKQEIDIILLDPETSNEAELSSIPTLLHNSPLTRVILIAEASSANASFTVKALAMGASDYITKPQNSLNNELFSAQLLDKIHTLAKQTFQLRKLKQSKAITFEPFKAPPQSTITLRERKKISTPQAIAIGSSTGGPEALTQLFKSLAGKIKHTPIFITQHLPPSFTSSLTTHIQNASGVGCIEPGDQEIIKPGKIYLAPGDYHMELKRNAANEVVVNLTQTPPENFCRPSVDPMLRSLAEIYGKHLLTIILTGMGKDGLEGCKSVAGHEGIIVAQDEASSVVWGMPGSVATAGLCNAVLPLSDISEYIFKVMGGKL